MNHYSDFGGKMFRIIMRFFCVCSILCWPSFAETITGELSVMVYDHLDQSPPNFSHRIKPFGQQSGSYDLILGPQYENIGLVSGDIVEVSGELIADDVFFVDTMFVSERVYQGLPSDGATIALIMVDLRDSKISDQFSKAQVNNAMGEMKAGFSELSYGKFTFNIDANNDGQNDVLGPFAIDESKNTCNFDLWQQKALLAAQASGIDLSLYKHRMFLIAAANCGYAGFAEVGCGTSCSAFIINPTIFALYAHELGHNFGLFHAATDFNDDNVMEDVYGDNSCPMGGNYHVDKLYNAPHALRLAWIFPVYMMPNQTFKLSAMYLNDDEATYPQIVYSQKDNYRIYTFSFRRARGFDADLPEEYTGGVSVHSFLRSTRGESMLIKVLKPGDSWVGQGIKIDDIQIDGDEATVVINTMCSVNPSAKIEPEFYMVDQNGRASGTILLTNNNDLGCLPNTYALGTKYDEDFYLTLEQRRVSLAPGETARIKFELNANYLLPKWKSFNFYYYDERIGSPNTSLPLLGWVWLYPGVVTYQPGLETQVFRGRWSLVPNFQGIIPVDELISARITTGSYGDQDNFAMHFSGFIRIDQDGTYSFYLSSDDGSWLSIDNSKLVDNDGLHGNRERLGRIFLNKGYHPLEVGYFERSGAATLSLSYELPGVFSKTEVEAEKLFHANSTTID